jgi:hypothetical protein
MATDVDVVDVDLVVPSELLAMHGPFKLTKTGVIATRVATFDEWEAALTWCQDVEKASPWWVGDLIEHGELAFGEKYSQALDSTRYTEQALKDIAYVVRNVDSSRRRDELSFSHHREVAALPPAEQDHWLDKTEVEGLTVQQLRIQIKAAKAEAEGHPVELWLQVKCTDATDQIELAERLRVEGRFVKLTTKGT